ncbi:MAG: hypothetical protein CUN48_01140 [Candidatus Thermofonsia Clade 3 bacterium]|jgi:uncharacterized alkaline shock family protein YloU|uniref:Asp23/Gls24 family envelope stress response protein n=1 Tax=Candidatus Thermofonsia Clade 3 bacterium TaxID=2364212 RepID=A0A2M8QGG5_9CHLR|nr:Asp23/Gls24 family envelope stress response protein [Candidatus Roseilinea sp. NK_OTU-006]PJF48896.1 MAG: hypothetical protein CUN48_01140 [Candidatus Thermofonsia Clade 3 bacterium]
MAQSSVTISPDVVRTIVRNTVLAMPSVRGLVDHTRTLRPRDSYKGIQISMDGDDVRVELHLTAAQDVSLVELGRAVQSEVQQAVREILGLRVSAVDVYFEDVTA